MACRTSTPLRRLSCLFISKCLSGQYFPIALPRASGLALKLKIHASFRLLLISSSRLLRLFFDVNAECHFSLSYSLRGLVKKPAETSARWRPNRLRENCLNQKRPLFLHHSFNFSTKFNLCVGESVYIQGMSRGTGSGWRWGRK